MWLSQFLLVLVVIALCVSAEAQQQGKIPRIGVLLDSDSPRLKSFRQGLRDLGYIEDKNILIEYRFAKGNPDRISALAADLIDKKVKLILTAGTAWGRTSTSQGKHHRHRWSPSNPSCQASNIHDSHCDGAGPRSCWKRVRRQPCATWREYYWTVNPCPGDKWKTTGASFLDFPAWPSSGLQHSRVTRKR